MKKVLFLICILSFSFLSICADEFLGNDASQTIILSSAGRPRPHMIDLSEPVAYYTISTATLDFTFDTTYYSEYTIHLVGDYVEMDYFVYTPVVYIPVATFGDIVDIYIESEDCGCYFGSLDKTAYTEMY